MRNMINVKLYETSEYGELVTIESWPIMNENEIKAELHEALNEFNEDEITNGITICINCILRKDNDFTAQNMIGFTTDGMSSINEAKDLIDKGLLFWDNLESPFSQTTVEILHK